MNDQTPEFLIWSNGCSAWWGPDHRGYTTIIGQAGRYSRQEARQICTLANAFIEEGNEPHEVAVPLPVEIPMTDG